MTEQILVVDDNVANLTLMAALLRSEGYEVATADDGPAALRVLAACTPSLILMDIQLPGKDGIELTRQLKADPATAAIPVVAVTAYAMQGDDRKALDAGCVGYVTKPIDTRRLLRLVEETLAAGRMPTASGECPSG